MTEGKARKNIYRDVTSIDRAHQCSNDRRALRFASLTEFRFVYAFLPAPPRGLCGLKRYDKVDCCLLYIKGRSTMLVQKVQSCCSNLHRDKRLQSTSPVFWKLCRSALAGSSLAQEWRFMMCGLERRRLRCDVGNAAVDAK